MSNSGNTPRNPEEKTGSTFPPSAVDLFGSFPPLVATFDRTELEVAAATLVLAMAGRPENDWSPVTKDDVGAYLKGHVAAYHDAGPDRATSLTRLARDLVTNPFIRPDWWGLVDKGFARCTGAPGESGLEF